MDLNVQQPKNTNCYAHRPPPRPVATPPPRHSEWHDRLFVLCDWRSILDDNNTGQWALQQKPTLTLTTESPARSLRFLSSPPIQPQLASGENRRKSPAARRRRPCLHIQIRCARGVAFPSRFLLAANRRLASGILPDTLISRTLLRICTSSTSSVFVGFRRGSGSRRVCRSRGRGRTV
jgi:hypothetical protein